MTATRHRRRWQIGSAALLAITFVVPMIVHGVSDREEYYNTIVSVFLNAQSLREAGEFLVWTDKLGFGMPMPVGHDSTIYPLFWLWPDVSLTVLLPVYWMLHIGIGAFFFSRLLDLLDVRGPLHLVGLFTYVFASPYQTYVYQNDWPSLFFNWAMWPPILFYALRLVYRDHLNAPVLSVARLALLIGICIAKAHFGHLAILMFCSGVVLLLAARDQPRSLLYLGASVALGVLIGSGNIVYVASEAFQFPAVPRDAQRGYTLKQILAALVQPLRLEWLERPSVPMTWMEFKKFAREYLGIIVQVRYPGFGAPFMVGSVVAAAHYIWAAGRAWDGRLLWSLAVGFVVACVASLLKPEHFFHIPSGTWLFRDAVVLFGTLLAATFFSRKLSTSAIRVVAALQFAIVGATVFPWFVTTSNSPYWYSPVDHGARTALAAVAEAAKGRGHRIYLGPNAERVFGKTPEFSVWGLQTVNGWFKGVSADRFYPSAYLMHGMIKGEAEILKNGPVIDLLGIDLVLLANDDLKGEPLPASFKEIWRESFGRHELRLYRNEAVWPRAFLAGPAVEGLAGFAPREGCSVAGFLCADVSALTELRLPGTVNVVEGNGRRHVSLPQSSSPAVLVVPTMFRPEWKAYSGSMPLPVISVGGVLLGVRLPAGTQEVQLEYRPDMRLALRKVGLLVAAGCTIAWAGSAFWARRRRSAAPPTRSGDGVAPFHSF